MIAAVQTEVQQEVTEIIQPVETMTEDMTEQENPVITEPQKEEIVDKEELKEDTPEKQETTQAQTQADAKPIDRPDKTDEAIAEQLPEYPGGMTELVTWLTKTIVYPPAARKMKLEGEVQVSFIIEKDGSLTDIRIHRAAAHAFNEEALRVARLMPKWKPGTIGGKPCRTQFVIPIQFTL